jgi:hypothetical protein
MVPQVLGGHIAGGLASLLEVLIGPMDLRLRGAGGVERGARIPVEEHVVAGFSGVEISHGSGGCRSEGSRTGYLEQRC